MTTSGEVKPFNGNANRCAHGVWMGDRCYKCDPPQSDSGDAQARRDHTYRGAYVVMDLTHRGPAV